MYEIIIGYYNVRSSVHDYRIKFWLQSKVIGSKTSSYERKGKNFGSPEELRRLLNTYNMIWRNVNKNSRLWENLHQALKTLIRSSSGRTRSYRNFGCLGDFSSFEETSLSSFDSIVCRPRVKTNKELQRQRECSRSFPKKQKLPLVI